MTYTEDEFKLKILDKCHTNTAILIPHVISDRKAQVRTIKKNGMQKPTNLIKR